ncbi:putative nuclease HARBI1 [Dermacentor silvarum]|nr:putative nuclease HARBI1 [Dermacentor silvarum]
MIAEELLAMITSLFGVLFARSSPTHEPDEDYIGDEFALVLHLMKLHRQDRHRVPLYVESVVPTYMEFEFKKLFRLSRSTCGALIEEFEASSYYPEGTRGRPQISAEKTLLIALTYIGTQQTMYHIADKFDVSESTVHGAISRVLDFIFSISAREICWPDRDEKERSKRAFSELVRRRSGLPDVIGAIDGCHVRISRPSESEQSYYNRKKFHSIILQGVCNADMLFIDVFIGIPGSAHDARVLRDSFLYDEAPTNCEGGYLLGDAAYPLTTWLLPPYRQTTANWQPWMTAFNYAHSKQRVVIEGAFGILKARFQRLLWIDVGSIKQAVQIVLAACVLHNKARRCGDFVEDLEASDSGTDVSSAEPAEGDDAPALSAAAFRDSIAQSL